MGTDSSCQDLATTTRRLEKNKKCQPNFIPIGILMAFYRDTLLTVINYPAVRERLVKHKHGVGFGLEGGGRPGGAENSGALHYFSLPECCMCCVERNGCLSPYFRFVPELFQKTLRFFHQGLRLLSERLPVSGRLF